MPQASDKQGVLLAVEVVMFQILLQKQLNLLGKIELLSKMHEHQKSNHQELIAAGKEVFDLLTRVRSTLSRNGLMLDRLQSLPHTQRESTRDPAGRKSGLPLVSDPTSPGEVGSSTQEKTTALRQPKLEPEYHLLTKEMAQHLLDSLPLPRHIAKVPMSLVEEWRELTQFASGADESKDS